MRIHDALAMRHADAALLAAALSEGRAQLLALHAQLYTLCGDRAFPLRDALNPLRWELGHVGWFEEWWLARNPARERAQGIACDPLAARRDSLLAQADALYDSSHVPHDTRWSLPLPSYADTLAYLQAVREQSLALLAQLTQTTPTDDDLYFFRLALFHEDMHREALIYMAQTEGLNLLIPSPLSSSSLAINLESISILSQVYAMGRTHEGFSFDNELGVHEQPLASYEIDSQAVSWARYLPFVEAGGYAQSQWWSSDGWKWVQAQAAPKLPRYLRRDTNGQWQRCAFGQWQALDLNAAAVNLSYYEAEAWCRWAGRRLPSEAEWECAAMSDDESRFAWGEVWEWTASPFTPYPGFTAHPYRDYSAPWFNSRKVLRGGASITAPRMKHPQYRNYFTPERNDIFAGFRSCALG
jgi:ergothioneine biosynthesis protein EgtB